MAYGGKQTLYDVLSLTRDASFEEVGRAYRRITAEMQRESTVPNARKQALVHEAYEVLSDQHRRAAYDRSLRRESFFGASGGPGPHRRWALIGLIGAVALAGAWYFVYGRGGIKAAPAMTAQEIHTAASVAVGRVNRVEMSGARSGLGVAVAIEEGQMMAPCEGIAPGTQVLVRIPPRDIPAQVASVDRAAGLCRLAVTGGASWPLRTTTLMPRIGDTVYAVNLGSLGEVVVSPGEVKKVTAVAGGSVVETSARAGNPIEGSPLLDTQGRVIAIAMKGRHTTIPRGWTADVPVAPRAARKPSDGRPAQTAPLPEEDPRLKNVPPEKREKLEKAFRPPPTLPDL